MIGLRSGLPRKAEHIENLIGAILRLALRARPHLKISAESGASSQRHVLQDSEITEDLRDLKRSGQSRRDKPIRRPCGHVAAVQNYLTAGRSQETGYAVEHGRFAGAVRTDERMHLAAADVQVESVHREQRAEILG